MSENEEMHEASFRNERAHVRVSALQTRLGIPRTAHVQRDLSSAWTFFSLLNERSGNQG